MEIKKASFYKSIYLIKDLVEEDLPEIAISGHSNVGKSSFINSLTNNFKLARTSKTPGKTVSLNFYFINDSFFLVDMPGYGYSKSSDDKKINFLELSDQYLNNRKNLLGVIQLIDSSYISKEDTEMVNYLKGKNIKTLFVLTKLDKLKKNDRIKRLKLIKEELSISSEEIIFYSSLTKENLELVKKSIETFFN